MLGSGTLVPDADRGCAAHWVESSDARVLLDCGPGVLRSLDRYLLDWRRVSHVCITHFHTDHIGGLPGLLWALRHAADRNGESLAILGPVGLRDRLEHMAQAFGAYILDPGFPLEVVELAESETRSSGGVTVRTHKTVHTDVSLAVCLHFTQAPQVAVGYTGDTGPASGLSEFFRGVQALVCECSTDDNHPHPGHFTPKDVAALAADALPGVVILTHVYPQFDPSALVASVREHGFGGECFAAEDGWDVVLEGPGSS